jgi:hypothetical protein
MKAVTADDAPFAVAGQKRQQRAIKPGSTCPNRERFIDELLSKRKQQQIERETNGTGKRN